MTPNPRPFAAIARPFKIVFLGAPGVGKGTFAAKLGRLWCVPHISTGDLVREEIGRKTDIGKQIQAVANSGALVPDDLIVRMAAGRLAQPDCAGGFILDGFPRTIYQAEELEKIGKPAICVNLRLPDELLTKKLLGRRICKACGGNYNVTAIKEGDYDMPPLLPSEHDLAKCSGCASLQTRPDDNEGVIRNRLALYEKETLPLASFYNKLNKLMTFDVKKGIKDLNSLERQIVESLKTTDP